MVLRKSSTQEWTLGSFFSDFSLLRLVGYLLDKIEILGLNKFCVDRHKTNFLNLVKNDLDLVFANEGEITSLIDTTNFDEVISFCKEIKKHSIITRGEKGAISIYRNEVAEISAKKDLKIVDLTGAGDLFASVRCK